MYLKNILNKLFKIIFYTWEIQSINFIFYYFILHICLIYYLFVGESRLVYIC